MTLFTGGQVAVEPTSWYRPLAEVLRRIGPPAVLAGGGPRAGIVTGSGQ